jgi:hypothetical protein
MGEGRLCHLSLECGALTGPIAALRKPCTVASIFARRRTISRAITD